MLTLVSCVAATVASGQVTCSSSTATSLSLAWPSVPDTDLYYIALSATPLARPFALQTTTKQVITVTDLLPATDYYLTLRSHPRTENIVWGWRLATGPAVKCSTTVARTDIPHAIQRVGNRPNDTSMSLEWTPISATRRRPVEHLVGVRRVACTGVQVRGALEKWRWEVASGEDGASHTVLGLEPGCEWNVLVKDVGRDAVSEEHVMMRTATRGAIHTSAFRIAGEG